MSCERKKPYILAFKVTTLLICCNLFFPQDKPFHHVLSPPRTKLCFVPEQTFCKTLPASFRDFTFSHFFQPFQLVKPMILDTGSTEYTNMTFFSNSAPSPASFYLLQSAIVWKKVPSSFVSSLQPKRIKNTATARCWVMSGKVKMHTGWLVSEIICTGYISLFLDLVVD